MNSMIRGGGNRICSIAISFTLQKEKTSTSLMVVTFQQANSPVIAGKKCLLLLILMNGNQHWK